MADTVEAVGQRVLQEPADELLAAEGHDFGLAVGPIVSPPEADPVAIDAEDAAVGYRNAMRVAAEIGEHLCRSAERRLGEDDPVQLAPALGSYPPSAAVWLRLAGADQLVT